MRVEITSDVGDMLVDGELLPGVLESLEVSGELRIDGIEVAGQSGKSKQPMGFEDAQVTLTVKLLTDDESTCYQKLPAIIRVFYATNDAARPLVHRIVNQHSALWGIDEVLIKSVKTAETNADDTIKVQVTFEQYRPALVAKEEQAGATAVELPPDVQGLLGFGTTAEQGTNPVPSPIFVDDDLPQLP